MSEKPVREHDKFMLRLPDGMRDALKASAEENKRSMNAEIVARLEASFSLFQRLEAVADREDDLKLKITEMQADLIAFMIQQGQDPLEIRKMWTEEARKIAEERDAKKAEKPRRRLNLD